MNDSFIAINIICEDKILNKDKNPIIMYLSSDDDLKDILQSNKNFTNYIKTICLSVDIYQKAKIHTISIEFDNENNNTQVFDLQDLFTIDNFEKILEEITIKVFDDLYVYVYKKNYEFNKLLSHNENLTNLYNEIVETYKDKINSNTAFHYFVSEIKKQYNLNTTNIEYISEYIKTILKIE